MFKTMESQTLSLHHDTKKKKKGKKEQKEEEIRQIHEADEHPFTSGFPHRKEAFEI